MRKLSLIVGAFLGGLTAANAADMPVKAYMSPVPVSNWTGMYFGGFVGGSWVDGNWGAFGFQTGLRDSGVIGGVYLGYDYEFANRFVIGGKVVLPLASIDRSHTGPVGGFLAGDTVKEDFLWGTSINMTFGYDMGRWMPYLGVGAAFADNRESLAIGGVAAGTDTELHTGLNTLVGIKYAWTQHFAVGLQFNHAEFARATYNFGVAPFFATGTGSFSENSLVATAEYRF